MTVVGGTEVPFVHPCQDFFLGGGGSERGTLRNGSGGSMAGQRKLVAMFQPP